MSVQLQNMHSIICFAESRMSKTDKIVWQREYIWKIKAVYKTNCIYICMFRVNPVDVQTAVFDGVVLLA